MTLGACETPSTSNPDGRTGTVAGYFAHRRKKEVPCASCKTAWAADQMAKRTEDSDMVYDPSLASRPDSFPVAVNPDWQDQARCKPPAGDNSIFFPALTSEGMNHTTIPRAIVPFCSSCPVRSECLTVGLDERYGFWGGMSPGQRAKLRNELTIR